MASVQFKFILPIFLVAAFLILPSIQAKPVKYCDKTGNNYAVKISGVDINPEPVVSGKPATFKIHASTEQELLGAELVLEVRYFGVHVHTEKHDLCEEAGGGCPIKTGDFVISHSQDLPGFTPPGPYSLQMKMNSKDGDQLTCISFNFRIKADYVADI
ncbi:hypothetical protein C5167_003713 [Papaver somniferum]|uniref:MD-2-related lipid-recognition domain-containing protein n=1 Tax=Papaver somniferum TaxID=3469 RepID=A0A4Y7KX15_PAPSO|nr:phosphatidylglycerol/phosphatidylinositol transfer protein-like [Papaver somniferum]RZC77863.1 hypothetical protein C5167_003713 [Papaver somniferum]